MTAFRDITPKEIESNLLNLKQLTFEVTDACNLKCRYCGYGDMYFGYDKRGANNLPINKGIMLLDYLNSLWEKQTPLEKKPQTYISFYGGEPLMNMPFIKAIIKHIRSFKVRREFLFSMTTNAVLLDKYMDFLAKNRIHLLVSLDGDKKGHSYRVNHNGENSFDIVFRNVSMLKTKYPQYFSEYVNFNAVLHNRNSVEGIYNFIKRNFDKEPNISSLNNSEIKEDKKEEFNSTFKSKEESIRESKNCEELTDKLFLTDPSTYDLMLYLHQYSGNVFRDYNSLFIDRDKLKISNTGTCSPFSKKMFLTVNGKILQCERINHDFALGMVSEKGIELNLDKISSYFNALLKKIRKQCRSCENIKACIQCVYYIEGISAKNPKCLAYMNEDSFRRYESSCLHHLSKHPQLYKKIINDIIVD